MRRSGDTLIVGKNRRQAFWSLVIISFMLPVSIWFLIMGLQPRPGGIGWPMVAFGALGLAAFAGYAVLIIRTIRAPWHLAIGPSHFCLFTPTYDLSVPWERVAGIAVSEVNRRPGCVLVFDDVAAVVRGAVFHRVPAPQGAVTGPGTMQSRMEESFAAFGYHLGIPGRILELGPEGLAELMTRARTGDVEQERQA